MVVRPAAVVGQFATVIDVIDAPKADIWAVLTDFANPRRLAPSIDHCSASGSGVGAIRVVESSRGLRISERLLEADFASGRYRYEVLADGDMPLVGITSYECTVTLSPVTDDLTQITWSSVGAVDGPVEPITDFLETLYRRATDRIRAEVAAS